MKIKYALEPMNGEIVFDRERLKSYNDKQLYRLFKHYAGRAFYGSFWAFQVVHAIACERNFRRVK